MSKLIAARKIGKVPVKNRINEIIKACEGKKVLHFGCADYPFTSQRGESLLHLQLSKICKELHGIDINGLDELRDLGFDNLYSTPGEVVDRDFDVIVAGEIIEHLSNPGQFLDQVQALMGENTILLLTTINAFTLKIFLHSFFGREKVHPDHNYYFSYFTLKQLIEKHRLSILNWCYYQENNTKLDSLFLTASKLFPALSDGLIFYINKHEV